MEMDSSADREGSLKTNRRGFFSLFMGLVPLRAVAGQQRWVPVSSMPKALPVFVLDIREKGSVREMHIEGPDVEFIDEQVGIFLQERNRR